MVASPRLRAAARRCLGAAVAACGRPGPGRLDGLRRLPGADPVKGEATFSAAGGYARLVLKLAEDVDSEVTAAGSIIVIRFKQPVDIPVDKLSDAVPDYVGSARRDPDGSAIRLSLARRVTINTMTAGERVFVDLLPDSWNGPPPGLPLEVIRELSERARAAERALRQQRAIAEAKKRAPIRVRASVQPTFVRFVFEMPDGVGVSSVLNDQKLTLPFNAALTFDLADAKLAAPSNVASINQKIEGDSSAVEVALIGDVDVHSFREDKNYIVDVAFQQAEKPSALLSPAADASHAAPRGQPLRRQPRRLPAACQPRLRQPLPATSRCRRQRRRPRPARHPANPRRRSSRRSCAVKPEAARGSKPRPMPRRRRRHRSPSEAPKPAPPRAGSAGFAAGDAAAKNGRCRARADRRPKPGPATVPPSVDAKRDSDGLRLTFSFAAATPAALFRRADTVWLVFDSTKPIDIEPIRSKGGAVIADVSLMPLDKGQAIRIRLNRPQMPSLTGDDQASGANWTLTFADAMQTPTQPLTAIRNISRSRAMPMSRCRLPGPGRLHRLVDPDAGDTLMVVTAPPPVRGFIKRQDFVEMSLLESIHGVAVRPNSDDVTAEIAPDKIILGRPGGLTLSSADAGAERAPTAVRPIFDVGEWRKNQARSFIARERRADRRGGGAPSPISARRRGSIWPASIWRAGCIRKPRACSIWRWPMPSRAQEDPAALIVHSVASTLMGRPELGLKDLANPAIGANYDSQLWKALACARQGKWAEAREKFKNVEFAITSLPIELQRIVITDAMRASLEVKDYSGAAKRSSDLEVIGVPPEQKPAVAVLRGRLAEALGHDKDALGRIQDRGRIRRTAPRRPKPSCSRSRCGRSATKSARPMRCASSRRFR